MPKSPGYVNGETMEILMSDPAFRNAMDDVRSRLQNGTACWHTLEDVFGDWTPPSIPITT